MSHPIEPKNWVDRAVEFVAPNFAARRYAARAAIEVARSMPVASYRGAIATRTSTPWGTSTSYRGGRAADRSDYRAMRDRGRRAYDENPIAKSLLDTETDNIVAEGFSLQMRTTSSDFNREAEQRFYDWLENADVAGSMSASDWFRASWREPRKDGDGGILLARRGGYPKLQFIPGDLIVNPRRRYDPRTMFDGVETDPAGRPVRFWVRDVDEYGKDDVTGVPARDFVFLAPGRGVMEARGATCYRSIFGSLDQIDAYVDAVTIASRMACIFGLIRKSRNPAAALAGLGSLPNANGDMQRAVTLENGMLNVIGTDEDVVQVQAQQPLQQAPEWVRTAFRIICLPFDMPLEIGMKDLSQVNFSGGRIGLLGYYRSCRVKQDWIKSRCWNRIAFWWLSVERQRQELGFADAFRTPFPADYGTFELHGREWDYTDPVSEAQADLLEISMGIKSPQQASELRGRDWGSTQAQIAEARRIKGELGIPNVQSSLTRDESQKVTAVDADGNPVGGTGAPLNGVQITAAMDVLAKVTENTIPDAAAVEMLERLGIAPDRAKAIVTAAKANRTGISAGDRTYQRDLLLKLMDVPQAREIVYNAVDVEDLIRQTGLPPEAGYEAPYAAVVAPTGPLVSGAVIRDPEGDIVGGDVENTDEPDAATRGGGTRNANPTAQTTNGGATD